MRSEERALVGTRALCMLIMKKIPLEDPLDQPIPKGTPPLNQQEKNNDAMRIG